MSMIKKHQMREQGPPDEIAAIRAALIEAEESVKQDGYSKKSVDEIWEQAKEKQGSA